MMLLRKIRIRVMLMVLLLQGIFVSTAHAIGVGGSGMYQWSVDLRGYISSETGKAPVAYLWVPDGCKQVKAGRKSGFPSPWNCWLCPDC